MMYFIGGCLHAAAGRCEDNQTEEPETQEVWQK